MKTFSRRVVLLACALLGTGVLPVVNAGPAQAACAATGGSAILIKDPPLAGSTALVYGTVYMNTSGCTKTNVRVVEAVFNFNNLDGQSTPVTCVNNPIYTLNNNNGAVCVTGDPVVGAVPMPGVAVSAPHFIVVATGVAGTDPFVGTCSMSYASGYCTLNVVA